MKQIEQKTWSFAHARGRYALPALLLALLCQLSTVAFAQNTLDKLHGYAGVFLGPTTWTPDSHTGLPGDWAIDFGAAGGTHATVTNMAWVNSAASNDVLSLSIWVKRYDINASSAFWMYSPSINDRAFQAHVPWNNDNIYFDTDGCCGGNTQRINQSIAGFDQYANVGNDTWWQQWNHFVFLKNKGDKQIWINNELFLDGSNTNPLPTDISYMYIGDGGGSMHGKVDDLAIYSTALGTNEIALLFNGTAPDKLAATNGILAYWSFNDPPPVGVPSATDRKSVV